MNTDHIDSNKAAIELLELSIMEVSKKFQEKNSMLESMISAIKSSHKKEIDELLLKNKEL